MHGTYHPQDAFSCTPNDSAFFNLSMDTEAKLAALQAKLNQKLGPEFISTRPGGNGMKLTYTEGWKVINLANEVFGFNGWSTSVVNVTCDFADYDPNTQRHTVGIAATVRVTLRDGVYHEDIGYGMMENSKSKGAAFDKCRKEAVTDGLKRALRNFGNLLGNCLYDKEYTKEIQKIKAPLPPKLDKDSLHRRPDFVEQKPSPNLVKPTAGPSSINQNDTRNQNHSTDHHHASTNNDQPAKPEPVAQQLSGHSTSVNNHTVQSNATASTGPKPKNVPQQNNSRPMPNPGNNATNVYRPPPPKNQPTAAPPPAPKQQQPQPAAKPDTADPATTSIDVDYMAEVDDVTFFESDDEKWMMGDFDIDLDGDLGRPIDFDAEESVTNDDSGFADANTSSGNADPRKGTVSVSGPGASGSVPTLRDGTVSVSGHNDNVGNTGLDSSTSGRTNPGGSNLVKPTSTGVNPTGNGNGGGKEVSFQLPPNVRFTSGGNDRGQQSNGSAGTGTGGGNGNNGHGTRTNPSNSTSGVQPPGLGNSGRPSAGGFSFPPGANQSRIGSKRPAESMHQHPQQQPGGSGFRRVSTGMGLSAMPTHGGNTGNGNRSDGNGNPTIPLKREPLGNLFVAGEDGGGPDPKRMRR